MFRIIKDFLTVVGFLTITKIVIDAYDEVKKEEESEEITNEEESAE